ncbi:helix-turn-helix transcriptional regulator [Cellulosimicrobium cellulans]|uniref:helix-turn-helix transcriptional regulator n=1 Tax=Cellulosimicrobium cellulans TaxID=1710 RepID=UPI001EDB4ECC|nr:helix-turn-helix transcriptional regulator [Cellulosimicrobium cellulans]UKJ63129.1 helix-turn-helix transcriptional regulator [Cellulosimicrobium cellulans]
MTSSERDPVLGARRSARAVALRRARDVLVLDDGSSHDPDPLWARVHEQTRREARVRVVTVEPAGPSRTGTTDDVPSERETPDDSPSDDAPPAADRRPVPGVPDDVLATGTAVEHRVAPALPLSLVALDDTVVLVARPDRTRAVTDRDAVRALRALAESEWDRARAADDALAPSEDTLLRLLAEGKTDTAVAARLGVSPRTVRRHAAGLMGRLGATSRFEAGARAAQRGWIRITDR